MSSSNDSKPDNFHVNARICRLVSRYPCMYDRSHQFYLKKDVVDKAWLKIAKEMDDSIPSCKERWRNIRTSFARSINVNKIPASANRTKPYYLHEELQFLARHITPGIPVSRRSNNNSYYSAGEESEVIEVSVGEESFDGFAQMVQNSAEEVEDDEEEEDEEQEEQDSEAEQQSSVGDADVERNNNNNECGINGGVGGGIVKAEQQLTKLQAPRATPTPTPTPLPVVVVTAPEPVQKHARNEDDEQHEATPAALPVLAIICPPKKRQRLMVRDNDEAVAVKEMASPTPEAQPEPETECDVKPNISLTADTDFDAIFLQNLLPEMKAMNFRQKLIFKRRIYEVIGDIFEAPAAQQPETTTANATSSAQANLNYLNANRLVHTLPAPPQQPLSFPYAATTVTASAAPLAAVAPTSTMTVVNAADLAMIRRLNSLLQSPSSTGSTAAASSTTVTAVPKNVASISSTVRSTPPPATATVAVHRGALTRSSANLLRVTMVNAPSSSTSNSSSSASASAAPAASTRTSATSSAYANVMHVPPIVKLERDDAEALECVD